MKYPRFFIPFPPKGRTDILYWKVLNERGDFVYYDTKLRKGRRNGHPWDSYINDNFIREVLAEEFVLMECFKG